MEADKDGDGKISFEEFSQMVASTVRPLKISLIAGCGSEHDIGRCIDCLYEYIRGYTLLSSNLGSITIYHF